MSNEPPSRIHSPKDSYNPYRSPLPSPFYLHRVLFWCPQEEKSFDNVELPSSPSHSGYPNLLENDGNTEVKNEPS